MTVEIIVAAVAVATLLASVIISVIVTVWAITKSDRDYPISVPGWKTKIANLPPHMTAYDVARINELMTANCVALKGYKKKEVIKVLDSLRWKFIEQDNSIGRMAVYDPYGRRDKKTGKTITIAGWSDGSNVYVVWAPGVSLGQTAAAHECGHSLKTAIETSLRDHHKDVMMFGDPENDTTLGVVDLVKRDF